jgi:hypothetical protein
VIAALIWPALYVSAFAWLILTVVATYALRPDPQANFFERTSRFWPFSGVAMIFALVMLQRWNEQ